MKKLLLSALWLAPALPAWSQTTPPVASTGIPLITITTPAINTTSKLLITGTAVDTGVSSGSGSTTSAAGINAVYYQVEGSSKWRRARLTATGQASVTWIVDTTVKTAVGKRYYFRAVDVSGFESDIVGRRFKRGS